MLGVTISRHSRLAKKSRASFQEKSVCTATARNRFQLLKVRLLTTKNLTALGPEEFSKSESSRRLSLLQKAATFSEENLKNPPQFYPEYGLQNNIDSRDFHRWHVSPWAGKGRSLCWSGSSVLGRKGYFFYLFLPGFSSVLIEKSLLITGFSWVLGLCEERFDNPV